MERLLSERKGFAVLSRNPNLQYKHDIVIFAGNKYHFHSNRVSKHKHNHVYYRCSYKYKRGGKIHQCQHSITLNKALTELKYDHDDGYDQFIQKIQKQAVHLDDHDNTWTDNKLKKEYSLRTLVSMGEDIGKAKIAWQQFQRYNPQISLVFTGYKQVSSILHDKMTKYKPNLPKNPEQAISELCSNKTKYSYNWWGRQQFEAEQIASDPAVSDLLKVNKDDIYQALAAATHEVSIQKKRQKYLRAQLFTLTSSPLHNSTMVWAAEASIVIFGSNHAGLRLLAPLSTWFSHKTYTLSTMRDGTWSPPSLSPKSSEHHPWKQVQVIGVKIESHTMDRRSKFFNCFWALLPNKQQKTYEKMDELIEKGYQSRGYEMWNEQVKDILAAVRATTIKNSKISTSIRSTPNPSNHSNPACSIDDVKMDIDTEMKSETAEATKDQQCKPPLPAANTDSIDDKKQNDLNMDIDQETEIKIDPIAQSEDVEYKENARIYSPHAVHVDFEQAPINSLNQFAGSIIGCFFHFYQAVIKKIGKLGLKMNYLLDHQFRLSTILLVVCAFLPQEQMLAEIEVCLRNVAASAPNGKKLAVRQFIQYFRKTWVNGLYHINIWCVFLRWDRTSNLLERQNKELKAALGPNPYLWDFSNAIMHIDADETIAYQRLIQHGSAVFVMKRPEQRKREKELFDIMKDYDETGRKEPRKYLLSISAAYAKRVQDQAAILALLAEFEEKEPQVPVELVATKTIPGVTYIEDNNILATARQDILDQTLGGAAWKHVTSWPVWKRLCGKRKCLDATSTATLKTYNGAVVDLLNALIAVKFGSRWYPCCLTYVEGRSVVIYLNDSKEKWNVIEDFVKSIKDGDVKIADP